MTDLHQESLLECRPNYIRKAEVPPAQEMTLIRETYIRNYKEEEMYALNASAIAMIY